MKFLVFNGIVKSKDKQPLFCREKTAMEPKDFIFKSYPLTLLKATSDKNGITIDEIRYEWEMLPITIHKTGRHITKYREVIKEEITITVELETVNTEAEL